MENKMPDVNERLLGQDMFGDTIKPDIKGILKNKFLIPPFSVLSARDGDWQTRKRQWISLGIQSELGRETKGAVGEVFSRFNQYDKEVGRSGNRQEISTSIFDPVLCELMYSWFCPDGGVIIDPLCGGSVRGIVASIMGYRYWGCDLSGQQIDANIEQHKKICPDDVIRWVKGDALEQLKTAPGADFIFTCPPYGDLERYSDDPADLSTMPYSKFLETLWKIIALACLRLHSGCFSCIVVGDFRDKQGYLHNFVSDTIDGFLASGLKLYNEIILVTAVGSLPIRITKQFEAGKKIGKTHQNVLVFKKL